MYSAISIQRTGTFVTAKDSCLFQTVRELMLIYWYAHGTWVHILDDGVHQKRFQHTFECTLTCIKSI